MAPPTATFTPTLSEIPSPYATEKPGLHPRNRHRNGYDFSALTWSCPALAPFVVKNPRGRETINFADPIAVTHLNRALLHHHYGIARWEIPPGYLCPPIPGRADYIHHIADLLNEGGAPPRGSGVAVLDLGVGANCIFPILGVAEYGWRFVGSDIDPVGLESAAKIVATNPVLAGKIELRRQPSPMRFFDGVIKPGEMFALSVCNPPFHASPEEAAAGTRRKLRNLGSTPPGRPVLNFGGQSHELWCAGGESAFVQRMIAESALFRDRCGWFTSLVSKQENLPALQRALAAVRPSDTRTIDLAHGQKKTRIIAWTFRPRRRG